MKSKDKTGICFDTETTGLLLPRAADVIKQPFITEIYMCEFDLESFEVINEFETFVGIPVPLDEHITRITGITDEMLAEQDHFDVIAEDISDFCSASDLVLGQNIMFDLDVLSHNFRRYELEEITPTFQEKVCTVEMSYPMHNRRMKLGDLYKLATGKTLEGAHRARHDVHATLTVYQWLLSEGF